MKNFVKIASTLLLLVCFYACSSDYANKYTYTRNRFATVYFKDGKAGLSIDLDGDMSFDNFSTETDMQRFNVKAGDRVLAQIYIEESKTTTFEIIAMYKQIVSHPVYAIPQNADSYFRFNYTQIDPEFTYGQIWSNGHYINCGVVAQTSAEDDTNIRYYLYPDTIDHDTLCLTLYASIPDPCVGKNAISRLLNFDMSSLNIPVNNMQENQHRTKIVDELKAKRTSAITVKISSADSTKITNEEGKLVKVPSFSRKTTLSLDFLKD